VELAPRALQPEVGRGAAVAHDTGVDAEPASHEGSPGWQAGGVGAVVVVEDHRLPGETVDVGGGVSLVAVTAEMIWTQRVEVEEQYPHSHSLCLI
jgi:hypothetical protein